MIKQFIHWMQVEESGQALVEYIIITMLIAMVIVGALGAMGTSLNKIFVKAEAGLK